MYFRLGVDNDHFFFSISSPRVDSVPNKPQGLLASLLLLYMVSCPDQKGDPA